MTKTFIGVVKTLSESFSAVFSQQPPVAPSSSITSIDLKQSASAAIPGSSKKASAPFIVKNRLGKGVTLLLDNETSSYKYFLFGDRPGRNQTLELPDGGEAHLVLYKDRTLSQLQQVTEYVSPLREQTEQAEASLKLRIQGEKGKFDIPVSRADRRFFPFQFRGDEMGLNHHGMISEVTVENGCRKVVTLKSVLEIKNHYSRPVWVYKYEEDTSRYQAIAEILPDQTFPVPLKHVFSAPLEFNMMMSGATGENMGLEPYPWNKLLCSRDGNDCAEATVSQKIQCTNAENRPDVFLNVVGTRQEVFFERTGKATSSAYMIDIRPWIVLKNCLPVTLFYRVATNVEGYQGGIDDGAEETGDMKHLEPGATCYLEGVQQDFSKLVLKLFEFRSTDWICKELITESMPELATWRFVATSSSSGSSPANLKLDLSVNCTDMLGTRVFSIFAPFWMVNKTGRMLSYMSPQDSQNIIYHPVEYEQVPMMFSYASAKGLLFARNKRKACIRIDDSGWSDPFTLDTIEDAGKVSCTKKLATTQSSSADEGSVRHYVGVKINMSKSSLTNIITFTPFYIIQNASDRLVIGVREAEAAEFTFVHPNDSKPFWPVHGASRVVAAIAECPSTEVTAPFTLLDVHSTLLTLPNKYGGIHVEVRISSSETLLTVSEYQKGQAPVQLINHTRNMVIQYGQKAGKDEQVGSRKLFLAPMETCYFTWTRPDWPRALVWSLFKKPWNDDSEESEYVNELKSDGEGVIDIEIDGNVVANLAWVSFLDDMQRVLLFSEDAGLCYNLAHTTGEKERISLEVDVSVFGVGLSIVNNTNYENNYELLYVSISSSDVVWEIRKNGKTRYKPLTKAQCEAIEADYQVCIQTVVGNFLLMFLNSEG